MLIFDLTDTGSSPKATFSLMNPFLECPAYQILCTRSCKKIGASSIRKHDLEVTRKTAPTAWPPPEEPLSSELEVRSYQHRLFIKSSTEDEPLAERGHRLLDVFHHAGISFDKSIDFYLLPLALHPRRHLQLTFNLSNENRCLENEESDQSQSMP